MTINSQDYRLTNEEYAKYSKDYGQNSYKLINDLVNSKSYKNLTDDEKSTAIKDIYSYVKEINKVDYAKKVNQEYETSTLYNTVNELQKQKANVSSYFEYKANTQGMKKDIDKIKSLKDMDTDSKTRSIIYEQNLVTGESKEYPNLKEYYENNSALGSKNYRAYDIIDQYLDYKVKASDKLQELIKNGTKTEDQQLSDKEKTQLLVDSKYTNPQTEALYVNVIATGNNKTNGEKYENIKKMNGGSNKINTYLDYVLADKESDKKDDGTKNGESIKGTAKKKTVQAIQNTNLNQISKIYLLGTEYDLNTNAEINNYYTLKNYISEQSGEDQTKILKTLKGKKEMKDGKYKW